MNVLRSLQLSIIVLLAISIDRPTAWAQTEAQCLQGFDVDPAKFVTYFAVDENHQFEVPINSMSCVDAELFRERLFVQMDKNIYQSEAQIISALDMAESKLTDLQGALNNSVDKAQVKAAVLGAVTVVATVYAVSTTAACASAVVDGVGIAACGPAVRGSVAAVGAWAALQSHANSVAELKAAALKEITKQRGLIGALRQETDAASADMIKRNYSTLFNSICRAVQEQCLKD